jgi:hypothetical protein
LIRIVGRSNLLWVDAVCITQKDDIEKSWQVNMMQDMYTSASQVAAWVDIIDIDPSWVPGLLSA